MKTLRKLYYRLIPTYKRVDFKVCTWEAGDILIKGNPKWRIAKEDGHLSYPFVALEIRERIYE
jgi:hypothetical protein